MELILRWADSLKCPHSHFLWFVQRMVNRILQGHARYGLPNKNKKYAARAQAELTAYQKTGNAEHLFNAANYCCLETECPSHAKYHLDNAVGSVTRGKAKFKHDA